MDNFRELEGSSNQVGGIRTNNSNGVPTKQVIISLIATVALTVLFSFVILYKPLSSVEGVWVRQPDDNEMANGMVIEIKKTNY